MAAREAEVEAEKQRLAAEEAARKKAEKSKGKGGKPAGGKQRTPSPKKGREKDSPTTPPPGEYNSLEPLSRPNKCLPVIKCKSFGGLFEISAQSVMNALSQRFLLKFVTCA